MLYLDKPIGLMEGMMIYRDHQDRSMFYYAVERPRLAVNDGVPEFLLLKYRRDITDNPAFDPATATSLGGGFLAFTVDLSVDKEVYEKVRGKLGQFSEGGPVKLAPIQFRSGSVRLSIVQDREEVSDQLTETPPAGVQFFEKVYGATKPSLFGDNRATFAVSLSQEGATLVEAGLRSGLSPIGVLYDLKFLAMRPAFEVRITAEYKRIYEHLELEFGARAQIAAISLAVDIGAAFQKLRDEGVVRIEVLSFSDDADLRSKADSAFEWFKAELLKDFFNTALQPPSFMTRTGGGLLSQLQGLFGNLSQPQTGGSLTPQMGPPAPPAPPTATAERPRSLDSGVPPAGAANQQAATAGAANTAAPATGGTGAGSGPGIGVQAAFSLKYYRQEELKTRTFEYSMQAAVEWNIAPQGMFSTVARGVNLSRQIREVDLDDDFFRRVVSTISVAGDLDQAGVSLVAVNLEYPASTPLGAPPAASDGFTFQTGQLTPRTFNAWLNAARELDYRYRVQVHFKPDSPWLGAGGSVESDWLTTRSRQLIINPFDYAELYPVEVTWGHTGSGLVREAHIEARYQDLANGIDRSALFILKPGDAGHTFRLRLANPGLRSFQYRITYYFDENHKLTSPWQTREDGVIPVNDPFAGTYPIRIVPMLDRGAFVEAILSVRYDEPTTGYGRAFRRIYTPDTLSSEDVRLFNVSTPPGPYTYDLMVIRTDGSVYQRGPITSADPALLIADGEGATRFVIVRLIDTNLANAGLAAVRVELTGDGEEPDRDEVLFTDSQLAERRVLIMQPKTIANPRYHYRITGYTHAGQPVPGSSDFSTHATLLVPLPRA